MSSKAISHVYEAVYDPATKDKSEAMVTSVPAWRVTYNLWRQSKDELNQHHDSKTNQESMATTKVIQTLQSL